MSLRYITYIFFLLLLPVSAFCDGYTYNYSDNCKEAYRNYLSMQLPAGGKAIMREIKADPYNLMATYIADYEDFIILVFNGDERELKQRKGHLDERLDLLDKGDESSPWYRLCKAGVYLHWAVIHGRFGENFKAAMAFRKSFQLLKENRQQFPSFAPNNVFMGLEQSVVGTIPEDYKWLASILGLKGNVKNGVAMISGFINSHPAQDDLFREEALIYYCYLKFYLLSQQDSVWNFVNSNQFSVQNNLMRTFVKVNIAINFRKAETAIQTLRAAQATEHYNDFPVMDYEMGNALLLKLDFSGIQYLQHYVNRNAGKLYTKDSWQKMAFGWYLQQNTAKAAYCMQQIGKQGNEMVDADKQARRFAANNTWPNAGLLQARLLTDGGYYQQALAKLQAMRETDYSNITDKLEYEYRLGRIFEELNNTPKALQYYQQAISNGKDRPEQFAARAALQSGLINERQGRNREALAFFRLCLSMRHHDFQSSLDQQSKAGINRLSGGS